MSESPQYSLHCHWSIFIDVITSPICLFKYFLSFRISFKMSISLKIILTVFTNSKQQTAAEKHRRDESEYINLHDELWLALFKISNDASPLTSTVGWFLCLCVCRSISWSSPVTVWVLAQLLCWPSCCAAPSPPFSATRSLHQGASWGRRLYNQQVAVNTAELVLPWEIFW